MGLESLISAVRLLDDVAGLRVAIAGQRLRVQLETMRDKLGLGDRVALLGRVSDDELPLWYRAADLFVLPTLAYEGFGLVTAEALASGTPVVGTPVGATPELLEPLEPRLLARDAEPPRRLPKRSGRAVGSRRRRSGLGAETSPSLASPGTPYCRAGSGCSRTRCGAASSRAKRRAGRQELHPAPDR